MSLAKLIELRAREATVASHPAITVLSHRVRERFGGSVSAVLFYGSCLRGGDPFDGLVDLYVLVDGYRSAYRRLLPAVFNRLLPPSVYYLEAEASGRLVRAKYAVLSIADFRHGNSRRWFHSYLWARFAQPVGLVYARDPQAVEAVSAALASAVLTLVARVLPLMPERFDALTLWHTALRCTYAAELRAERGQRARVLVDQDLAYYREVTALALGSLGCAAEDEPGAGEATVFRNPSGPAARRLQPWLWRLRSVQGKLLSLLRLLKGAFTFDGGLDYIVWKLERHSGQRIEVSERVRRAPLIFIWGLIWRLYRRGVFR